MLFTSMEVLSEMLREARPSKRTVHCQGIHANRYCNSGPMQETWYYTSMKIGFYGALLLRHISPWSNVQNLPPPRENV